MKVGLQTWGSDGDIRPFIALGAGLVRRGHGVTLSIASVDNKDYEGVCRAVGVESVRAPERSDADLSVLLEKAGGTRNTTRMLRVLLEDVLAPGLDAMYPVADRLCRSSDVVVGHPFAWPLKVAAQKQNTPHASVVFWPGMVPNPARPPYGFPNLGRALNRLTWRLSEAVTGRAAGGCFRAFWRKHGLMPPGRILDAFYSERLNLIASSPCLWPPEHEESPHRFCGYFFLPEAADATPLSSEIETFLAAGEPPVFLTFGSAAQVDPDRCETLLVSTVERWSGRAIIQLSPGRKPPRPVTDRLYFVGRLRHDPLLRRCAAAVHHGGAGTTHTVLAAGKPAVVAGFTDEQVSWGRQAKWMGAAAGVFHYPRVTPLRLAAAIRRAADGDSFRVRAEELGERIRKEDGVGTAVRLIEEMVR